MKPRPVFSTFIIPQSHSSVASLPRHRYLHTRAATTALGCQIWHERSQCTTQRANYGRPFGAQVRRYAQSSAAPAKKTGYTFQAAPPPLSKAHKAKVPAKTGSSQAVYSARNAQSTSLPPAPLPASKSTTATTLRANEKLNLPPIAYAPDISVPARKADQNFIKWLWSAGRAYLSFYKTGISHVRQTAKLAKTLRQKAAAAAATQGPNHHKAMADVLTRAEWQLVRRSRADVLRLPVFGVLVLLLGEWLPVVVLYLTPVIPEVCRIPQQVERALRKREDKRQDRLRKIGLDAMRLLSKDRPSIATTSSSPSYHPSSPSSMPFAKGQTVPHGKTWRDMTLFELCITAAQLDCYPALFDWLPLTPPKWLLQRNVRKKMDYLETDRKLIERDGGLMGLNAEEVRRACVDRGLPVLGKREDELRKSLAVAWVEARV